MRSKSSKVSCLLILILIQVITVSCQNETSPTSSPEDLITSSHPMTMEALTSPTAAPTDKRKPSTTKMAPLVEEKTTTKAKTPATTQSPEEKTTSSEINTSTEKPVAMTTSHPKPMTTIGNKPTHHSEPIHPSEPTHHGNKNTTNTTHGGHGVHPGPHATMGYPHEPPVVNAYTKEVRDEGWQISIIVVCSMLAGIVAFVAFFIVKSNREMRQKNLRKRKRPVAENDNAIALKMIKTEEPKVIPAAEKKEKEKRFSMHSRGDPEESIPLLQLHIDGAHPILSKHIETLDPELTVKAIHGKNYKPLLEENANVVDAAVA
ncbi:uncharacterized protein LOC144667403 [Oculina patagonica]